MFGYLSPITAYIPRFASYQLLSVMRLDEMYYVVLCNICRTRNCTPSLDIPRLEPHDDLDCVALDIQQVAYGAYQIARYGYVLCTVGESGKPDQNGS